METNHSMYNDYSNFLRKKYGEKVYKLPVNLPVTCPNRKNGRPGCSFCAGCGTGFESFDSSVPVKAGRSQQAPGLSHKLHTVWQTAHACCRGHRGSEQ